MNAFKRLLLICQSFIKKTTISRIVLLLQMTFIGKNPHFVLKLNSLSEIMNIEGKIFLLVLVLMKLLVTFPDGTVETSHAFFIHFDSEDIFPGTVGPISSVRTNRECSFT